MPRTVDPRRLKKKSSQTMLAAQRRGAMEGNRLSQRLDELKAEADWGARSWGRDYRQAERQLSLANLVLSDDIIDVNTISGDRPRATSASRHRRQLAECLRRTGGGSGIGEVPDDEVARRRRQRRPASVFRAQVERQRDVKETEELLAVADSKLPPPPLSQQPQPPQAQPVRCLFPGCDSNIPCNRFPCCLPPTYSFMSNKREMLQLYDLLLSNLPPHRRPQSTDTAGPDLSSMISDAEYLVSAQQRVSTLDPVERARLLRQAVDDWKTKHSRQMPEPRETRYGKPYPMRRILKPISCSTSFFLN